MVWILHFPKTSCHRKTGRCVDLSENIASLPVIMHLVEAITLLLAVQFLLGMYLNLFWTGTGIIGEVVLAAHIGVAIAMISAAGVSLYLSLRTGAERRITVLVALTFASLISAAIMGLAFLDYGHSNIASFLMAVFFLLAYGFVGYASSVLGKRQNSHHSQPID